MSIGDLSNKLKDRMQQDREQMELIARSELEHLQQSLRKSSQLALHTIEADIAAKAETLGSAITSQLQHLSIQTTSLRKSLATAWLRTTALGLCLLLGLSLGAWGLTAIMSTHISDLWQQMKVLRETETQLRGTIATLEQQTWGIRLEHHENGRFIVLPLKASIETGWTIHNRKALKLE